MKLDRWIARFAELAFRARRSPRARAGYALLIVLSVAAAALAQPERAQQQSVVDYAVRDISVTTLERYVRVYGVLNEAEAYQTEYTLGLLTLRGGRFVPLYDFDGKASVFVLDEGLPPHRAGEPVLIVGQVMPGTGAQPSIYIQPGYPPNVVLANLAARLGMAALIGLIGLGGLGWLVDRADYALPALKAKPSPDAPALVWFGRLSRRDGDRPVVAAPVHFRAVPHEGNFIGEDEGWRIALRRLKAAHLFVVATPWGGMHAAWLSFEDELGLDRRGVIASRDERRLLDVLETLSALRSANA